MDTDIFAVDQEADEIFTHRKGIINFAKDPGKTVKKFSKYATKIPLTQAIKEKFNLDIPEKWQIWNGGLFLFDKHSIPFLNTWHQFTLDTFQDPIWKTRDQGALIAAVWKHGLQNNDTIPREYNWLHKLQSGLKNLPNGFRTKKGQKIKFLHFPVSYGDTKSETWNNLQKILNQA